MRTVRRTWRGGRGRALSAVLALAVTAGGWLASAPARGEETNVLTGTDLPSFRLISERNIFDTTRTSRTSRSRGEPERQVVVQAFALVGTMSYEKGSFAVFDGTDSTFRKVLKPSDAIAGHQLVSIGRNRVVLAAGDRRVELKVGEQLRREDEGPWEVRERGSVDFRRSTTASASTAAASGGEGGGTSSGATSGAPGGGSGGGGEDEILKRLLQKREQEMTK